MASRITLLPDGDINYGSSAWTTYGADYVSRFNEGVDAADAVGEDCPTKPPGAGDTYIEMTLDNPSDSDSLNSSGTANLRVNCKMMWATTTTIRLSLVQGTTVLASTSNFVVSSTSWTTYEEEVSLAGLTDQNDLRIRLEWIDQVQAARPLRASAVEVVADLASRRGSLAMMSVGQ